MPDLGIFYAAQTSRSVQMINPIRRLRVLHLGRFYHEGASAGIERHVSTLLSGLAEYIDVDNLVAADGLRGNALQLDDGYRVFRAPTGGTLFGVSLAPAMLLWARRLNRERHYDIIHLHFPDPLSHLIALTLGSSARIVVTWHSDIVRQKAILPLYRPILNRFLGNVNAVIVAAAANLNTSRQLDAVSPERKYVIPFGLDYTRFDKPELLQQAYAQRSRLAGHAPIILAVGRHVYYKGFEVLIRAMALIPDARLVLVGEGPLTGKFQNHARRLGVDNRITFTGWVEDNELASWYHACDVFCLPSTEISEAFGLVQLEAMACGKPVVCCRLGTGVDEVNVNGETGFVVEPRNEEQLAQALNQLLNNASLRQSMGQAARHRARNIYSFPAMVDATLALYEYLVREVSQ